MNSEERWRNTINSPGGVATCHSTKWLNNGCPKCGCKTWELTGDGWAYCDGCFVGIPHALSVPYVLARLHKDGTITELD